MVTEIEGRTCGTTRIDLSLLATEPGYATLRAASETAAWHAKDVRLSRPGVTRIEVVVHIVPGPDGIVVGDEQVQSQVAALNRDFRGLNSDRLSAPAPFQSVAADARIEFGLATMDPDGHPTTGIVRAASGGSFGLDHRVKRSASGGSDPWPTERYLNIWVCRLVAFLGHATFPGVAAEHDGVVLNERSFGTIGDLLPRFSLGRTATHEVGHWLNLRHMWGDDDKGCNGDDLVDDTPNCSGPNQGAPAYPSVTCGNGPHGDMFCNFMDYGDDAVAVMFTQGQVDRMQACLVADRPRIGREAGASSGVS